MPDPLSPAKNDVENLNATVSRIPRHLEQINHVIAQLHDNERLNSTSELTDEDVTAALEGLSDAHYGSRTAARARATSTGYSTAPPCDGAVVPARPGGSTGRA